MNMTPNDLKTWRKKFRLTQEQAAARFGVTRVTLQNWENGITRLPHHVFELCRIIASDIIRKSESIPVKLLYTDGPGWFDLQRGRGTRALTEKIPNVTDAITRSFELMSDKAAYSTDILDEDGEFVIYTNMELREMFDKGRAAPHV